MKPEPSAPNADGELNVRRLSGQWSRLGIACHFVARHEPFASFRSSELVNTLSAQIEREHCLFALQGSRVVGYFGWALYDAAVAERFARGAAPPHNSLAHGRDVVWLLTAAAAHPRAPLAMGRALRAQYPGMRVMGIRHKAAGQRVVVDLAARFAAPDGPAVAAPPASASVP